MRKLQIEDAEAMRAAIQQEIERNEESRYYHRLHAMLLVTTGHSCRAVAALLGASGTTVQRWVNRFRQGGLDALREGERSGRPCTLRANNWRALKSDLRKSPLDFNLASTLWDGAVLSEHLRRRYSVEVGARQCQRLLRELGFSSGRPRLPVAPSDPLKAAPIKKTSRFGAPMRRRAVEFS